MVDVIIFDWKGVSVTEPTAAECSRGAEVAPGVFATWYPQMGGYASVALVSPDGGCFDVLVWHNGDFPFSGEDGENEESPAELHHCDPDQFIQFGQLVKKWIEGTEG